MSIHDRSPENRFGRKPEFAGLPKADQNPLDAEWPLDRIKESGAGAELVRRVVVEELRGNFEAFCLTASTLEILIVNEVFELQSELSLGPEAPGQATFVEAFLTFLGLDPTAVLESGIQRRPIRMIGH